MDRSGDFLGKWSVKSEYKNTNNLPNQEIASPGGQDSGSQEVIELDDDDHMVEMEDVPM